MKAPARDTTNKAATALTIALDYRAPYRFKDLLSFFSARALAGIEVIDDNSYSRTVRLKDAQGRYLTGWVRVVDDPAHFRLVATLSKSLAPVMSQVEVRLRRQFDCASDPALIAEGLSSMKETVEGTPVIGTRLPGCFDSFETACRAVLGQQITVNAANTIAARIAKTYGMPISTGIYGLDRAWPTPAELLSLPNLQHAFGEQGVIVNRTNAIAQIARALQEGDLTLDPNADAETEIKTLLSMKGIGPWTANYIAMRAMAYPDAFLETDAGVAHALPNLTPKERATLAKMWRPWRSYAVINLWNSLKEN